MFNKAMILFVLISSLFGCGAAPSNVFNDLGKSIKNTVDNVEGKINTGVPNNGILSDLGVSLRGTLDNVENQINKQANEAHLVINVLDLAPLFKKIAILLTSVAKTNLKLLNENLTDIQNKVSRLNPVLGFEPFVQEIAFAKQYKLQKY